MIDLKPTVLQALEGNAALVSLLGGKRIYQLAAPNAEEYPRITFFEMTNFDSDFADDDPTTSMVSFQIDVWSKGSTTAIGQEVDRTMKSIGFRRTSSADLYEEDVKVYHKGMRFTIAVESA